MAYVPGPPPRNGDDLAAYLYAELLQLSAALRIVEEGGGLKIWQEAPAKPREGQIVIAAGTPGWDPGAGKGAYEYRSGTWAKL